MKDLMNSGSFTSTVGHSLMTGWLHMILPSKRFAAVLLILIGTECMLVHAS